MFQMYTEYLKEARLEFTGNHNPQSSVEAFQYFPITSLDLRKKAKMPAYLLTHVNNNKTFKIPIP